MADNANALIAFRTYPHIDMHERAWQAAELLERAMRVEVRPVTVIARRPMLHGLDWGRTQRGLMAELIARGEAPEADGKAQDDEALRVVAPLDDLHAPQRHLYHRSVHLPGVLAAVNSDQFEPREAPADLVEHRTGPIAVLDRGRQHTFGSGSKRRRAKGQIW